MKREREDNMSIIYNKLEALYEKNNDFEKLYPIEETSIKLKNFMVSELMAGKRYLHVKRFGLSSGLTEVQSFVLLLAISSMSNNGLLELKYRHTFPSGNQVFLLDKDLNDVVVSIPETNESMTLFDAISEEKIDVPIYFEIHPELRTEIYKL